MYIKKVWILPVLFLIGCETTSAYKSSFSSDEKHDISEVMKSARPQVRDCYAGAYEGVRRKFGILKLKWEINDEGQSQNIKVIQPLDKPVDDCIVGVVEKMKFDPAPRATVVNVSYPFQFVKTKDKKAEK